MEYVFASFVLDLRKGWKSKPINHEIISTLFNSVSYVPYGYNVTKDVASLYMTRKRDIVDDVRSDATSEAKRKGITEYFDSHVVSMLGEKKKAQLQQAVQSGIQLADNITVSQKEEVLAYSTQGLAAFLGHVFLLLVSINNKKNGETSPEIPRIDVNTDPYEQYLGSIKEEFCAMRTLLYKDTPEPFYSFYVCNRIRRTSYISRMKSQGQPVDDDDPKAVIKDCSTKYLTALSKYTILKGTGGLGKSMMMRHLLLDAIKSYEGIESMIPVFVALKDYSSWQGDFERYVFDSISRFADNIAIEQYQHDLKAGRYLLLFDGLDEVPTACACSFEREMAGFLSRYKNNFYVMSSRPISDFLPYSRFEIMQLEPLTKEQALLLVDRLNFRPDMPVIKEKFMKELSSRLFFSHYEFASNPLLLTIMLMTFERFGTIPYKMHRFYSEAYQVLAETHDASKGAYQRVFKTGLDSERLEAYFAEFCARTYMAEQFEVTDDAAKEIFNNLKEVKRHRESGIQFSSFMSDICDNLCLMYHENGKYHFMHRSFQEYFCALFFSRQMDDTLPAIANEFEKKRRRYGTDSTFGMLYDMITEKVEKKVFIPFLEDLFAKCDRKYGYWTFLEKVYPTIRYHVDNIGEDRVHQHPSSFLYDFISRVSGKRRSDEEGWREMPFIDSLIVKKYISLPVVVIDEDTNESQMWTEVFPEDEIPEEYEVDGYAENNGEVVGYVMEVDVRRIPCEQTYLECTIGDGTTLEEKSPYNPDLFEDEYKELLEAIVDQSYPLRIEYESMRRYLEKLKEYHQDRTNPADLFDLF